MSRHEFYKNDKAWRQTARYVWLKQHCLCAMCGRAVYVDKLCNYLPREKRLIGVVHHINPIDDVTYANLDLSLNEDNLAGLCQDCHALVHKKKSTREDVMFDDEGNLIKIDSKRVKP